MGGNRVEHVCLRCAAIFGARRARQNLMLSFVIVCAVLITFVTVDIDMGYGLMIWEMTVSIRSSPISIWDILSLCDIVHLVL